MHHRQPPSALARSLVSLRVQRLLWSLLCPLLLSVSSACDDSPQTKPDQAAELPPTDTQDEIDLIPELDLASELPELPEDGKDLPEQDQGEEDSPEQDQDPDFPNPPEDCFLDDVSAAPAATYPADFALGPFTIALDATGRFDVRHAADPQRSRFATPANYLAFAQVKLELEEHQGSFEAHEEVQLRCALSQLDAARFDGRTLVLSGAFADTEPACAELRFELQLCALSDGQLGFQLRGSDPSFAHIDLFMASEAEERIYGMGEQFPHDTLNLKGRRIPVLSQEGGVGRGHAVISTAVNLASPGSAGSEESTYYAAPHFLTDQFRSVFLENTEYAVFDFTQDDSIRMSVYAEQMRGRILQGESPLELIERFTEYAGRMPPLPDWVNQGAVVAMATDTVTSLERVDRLLAGGVELSAVWNQTWSGRVTTYIGEQVLWNWVSNPVYHPDWDAFVDALEDRELRVLCYVNPMFVQVPESARPLPRYLYEEGIEGGYFVHDEQGEVLHIPVTAFEVALLDLTNEDARRWMKDIIIEEVMGRGRCSGWMVDFAEALPFEAVMASGVSAAEYHNSYPVEWMRLNREAVEEAGRLGDIMLFNRAGHTRTPSYSLLLWQGDQLTTWDRYDGLVSALHGLISGGFSGIALNHSDIGGYTSLSKYSLGYSREREQLQRWTELSAFTAAFRTHEGNQPPENAQVYDDDESIAHFARMSKVYKALAFYRESLFEEASQKGWPLVRHLSLHYPDDAQAHAIDDQFLLGSELLVAPIKNKCWTWPLCPYDKELYLPRGEWVHLWSGEAMGGLAEGTWVTVQAPLGQPAVFYKRGSAVGERFLQELRALGLEVPEPSED
ncbi:MAG: alpha-glucosidase [Myxococcota bacterium]|jgi:alpha-glucosidase|nr:alpha-glucosidase [Myxococcota bacterium]